MGNTMSNPYQTVGMCSLDVPTHTPSTVPVTSCSLVQATPQPNGATCGFVGYLSRPNLLTSWTIATTDPHPQYTCTKACWDDSACGSSAYDGDTLECALYASAVIDQKPRTSKTGATFFEPACFYQTCEITEPVSRSETKSTLDIPLADLRLRHCGLNETVQLTDPQADYDEHSFFPVTLPFPVEMYGASTDSLYVSINGYLSFNSPFVTHPEPHALPHYTQMAKGSAFGVLPSVDGGLPENTICALWAEAKVVNTLTPAKISAPSVAPAYGVLHQQGNQFHSRILPRTESQPVIVKRDADEEKRFAQDEAAKAWLHDSLPQQGLRYTVFGQPGHRVVTFTWKTSHKGDTSAVLDFDIVYHEATPGIWKMRYRSVGGTGISGSAAQVAKLAAIGAQSTEASGLFIQYTSDTTPISEGMTLVLESKANILRRVRRTQTTKHREL